MHKKNRIFLYVLIFLPLIIYQPNVIHADNDTSSSVWLEPSGNYTLQVGNYGGKLIRSTTSDPRSFNPILAKETSTTTITSLLFEGLTRTDVVTLNVKPNLAESWHVDETGKKWIFNLRKDVFWSDGKKFTAKDVVFTFNDLIYNPDIPNSSRDIFTIDGKEIKVRAIDEFTVEFILPFKFAPFLRALSQSILPEHKLKEAVEDKKFSFTWGTNTEESEIIGTGPFVLEEYLPAERVILSRNPNYWKKDKEGNSLPYLDKIVFLVLQNQDTALLRFMDKELDFFSLRGQDLPILGPSQKEDNFVIYNAGPAFGNNFITFNQNPGKNPHTGKTFIPAYKLKWFQNEQFRKAIAYAIDKDKIIDIVYNGLGYAQFSPVSYANKYFYNDEVKKYRYNLDKAKSILKKAGFKDRDKDGFIEDKQGNKVRFTLFTNTGVPERLEIASMIRKDLSNLGMEVNFLPLEFNNLVVKLTSTFNWDAILIGLTGGIEPHFGKNVWDSSGHLHMWHPLQKKPATEWEAEINDIFNKGAQILDKDKRRKLYNRWQMIVSEKLPVIYTVISASVYAVRDRFGNLYPTVYGGPFGKIEYVFIR